MNFDKSDIVDALTKKGFQEDNKPRDHDWYWLYVKGKKQAIGTYLSRGTGYKVLGDYLIGKMSRQMKLTRPQFKDFVVCDMNGEAYLKHLVSLQPPVKLV